MIPALVPESHWVCPNCDLTQITHEAEPHTRFHACPGLRGLTAPMIKEDVRCKVEAVEREDYTRGDAVQTDDEGRPIMSVITTREDGQDCTVLAACADVGTEN